MIPIRRETQAFLDEVEKSTGRKFLFRYEVELLVEIADQRSMRQVFDDITFYAKFLSHSSTILKRFGPNNDETVKLSVEFKEKLEKTSTLIKTLIKEAPDSVKQQFMARFLSLSHESMNTFLLLLYELSWIKNYLLDQERAQE